MIETLVAKGFAYAALERRRLLRACGSSPSTAASPSGTSTTSSPAPGCEPGEAKRRPARLRALEGGQAGRAGLGVALGEGPPGLAHRVLGHGRRAPRHPHRPARRRQGPRLPPPHQRDRPVRRGARRRRARRGVRAVLGAQRLRGDRPREDVEVARQLLHHPRRAGASSTPRRCGSSCSAPTTATPSTTSDALLVEAERRLVLPLRDAREGGPARGGRARPARARRRTLVERRRAALDDDFNTPQVLGVLAEAFTAANALADRKGKKTPEDRASLSRFARDARHVGSSSASSAGAGRGPARAARQGRRPARHRRGARRAEISERAEARKAKDFARSDAMRDELLAMGVALMDGPQGTSWKVE